MEFIFTLLLFIFVASLTTIIPIVFGFAVLYIVWRVLKKKELV